MAAPTSPLPSRHPATEDRPDGNPDAPPPLLGSWRNVYLAVVLSQAAFIALLWAVCEAFS